MTSTKTSTTDVAAPTVAPIASPKSTALPGLALGETKAPATKGKGKTTDKKVTAKKAFKVSNIVTAGAHLRGYWIASMMVSGAWNGAEKAPRAFHWALSSNTAFNYHKGKGNIVAGSKGGYSLVQKGRALLIDKTTQDLIDGYKAVLTTGKAPDGFKIATVKGATPAIQSVAI